MSDEVSPASCCLQAHWGSTCIGSSEPCSAQLTATAGVLGCSASTGASTSGRTAVPSQLQAWLQAWNRGARAATATHAPQLLWSTRSLQTSMVLCQTFANHAMQHLRCASSTAATASLAQASPKGHASRSRKGADGSSRSSSSSSSGGSSSGSRSGSRSTNRTGQPQGQRLGAVQVAPRQKASSRVPEQEVDGALLTHKLTKAASLDDLRQLAAARAPVLNAIHVAALAVRVSGLAVHAAKQSSGSRRRGVGVVLISSSTCSGSGSDEGVPWCLKQA